MGDTERQTRNEYTRISRKDEYIRKSEMKTIEMVWAC